MIYHVFIVFLDWWADRGSDRGSRLGSLPEEDAEKAWDKLWEEDEYIELAGQEKKKWWAFGPCK